MVKTKENPPMKVKRGILNAYWKRTALLIGPLIFGIILAIVHDVIYAHFNGKIVESTTQQEWLGRVGTGLAFLIKKLFSTAVGVACVQMLWWTLKNKSTSVKTVDSLFSIVYNPLTLLDRHVVVNYRLFTEAPIIVLLAIISW
jgi:hypothetical protein